MHDVGRVVCDGSLGTFGFRALDFGDCTGPELESVVTRDAALGTE